jgi:hypothetical protein
MLVLKPLQPNTRGSLAILQSSGFFDVAGSPVQRAEGGGGYTYQELVSSGLVAQGGGTFAIQRQMAPFQQGVMKPLALIGERF